MADTPYNLSEAVGVQRFLLDWENAKNHSTQMNERERRNIILCCCICQPINLGEDSNRECFCVGGADYVPSKFDDDIEQMYSNDWVEVLRNGTVNFNASLSIHNSSIEKLPFKVGMVKSSLEFMYTNLKSVDLSGVTFQHNTSNRTIFLVGNDHLTSLKATGVDQIRDLRYLVLSPSSFNITSGSEWLSVYTKLLKNGVDICRSVKGGSVIMKLDHSMMVSDIHSLIVGKNSNLQRSDLANAIKYLKELVKTK